MTDDIGSTLVIIGNGFDLAHKYQTRYSDFVRAYPFSFFRFRRIVWKTIGKNVDWSDFETIIGKLVLGTYGEYITTRYYNKSFEKIDREYKKIQRKLAEYLRKETMFDNGIRYNNVEHYLLSAKYVINFNYTDIAERYSKNIYYIHGSLKSSIILGYDYIVEPCLMGYEGMRWKKQFQRDWLSFLQYAKINYPNVSEEKLRQHFDEYLSTAESARGFCDDCDEGSESYKSVFLAMQYYSENKNNFLPYYSVQYDDITRIVIIGHGIVADTAILTELINKCCNLSEFVLFTYNGESEDSLAKKHAALLEIRPGIKIIDVQYQ